MTKHPVFEDADSIVSIRDMGRILFKTPNLAVEYSKKLENLNIPAVECRTVKDLNALYQRWSLQENH